MATTGSRKSKKDRFTCIIEISGIVQGVGFRPFIYRLASRLGISGSVSNTAEGVLVTVNVSCMEELERFIGHIKSRKPPASEIENISFRRVDYIDFDGFSIGKSSLTGEKFQLVSPDIATCKKCIEDIFNPENKNRYLYPFTNCTNCGPRFTIIKKMPYDRPFTTMEKFGMCPDCIREYNDPSNRRFHAQPNACRKCGPRLVLEDRHGRSHGGTNPVKTATELIKEGKIIALKSLGGFQIACDATSDATVKKLRARKNRPVKPFAVMSGSITWIKKHYFLNKTELGLLSSPAAPILLLKKKKSCCPLSYYVSLYSRNDGIMLPYTPLHHIIFHYLDDIPLVMTSGNMSEEPITSDNREACRRLGDICDYFLTHDRDIYSRYDDSVLKVVKDRPLIVRRARGYSPYPVKLKTDIKKRSVLAVGAHEKNTFCILTGNYGLVSQHIGDLDDYQSMKFFKETLEDYRRLFNIRDFDIVAHDLHPGYSSTGFAMSMPDRIKKFPVQHHRAHLAAVLAENGIMDKAIGFSWDGTGYGDDGVIWGSEIFMIDGGREFKRVGHFMKKPLPGGAVTIRKPYRMAMVYLYGLWSKLESRKEKFTEFIYGNLPFYKKVVKEAEIETFEKQVKTGFNTRHTTSAGRFFDAVSSVLDLTHINSFEGEAAIHLEMSIKHPEKPCGKNSGEPLSYMPEISDNNGKLVIDDNCIFRQILDDRINNVPVEIIARKFHNTLCRIILYISMDLGKKHDTSIVLLSGGVFQNNYLLESCLLSLEKEGFRVFTGTKVPVNDGGISLGQAYLAALSLMH